MKNQIICFLSIVLSFLYSTNLIAAKNDFALWEQIKKPNEGNSQSIGSYSAGCLSGGVELPLSGLGYEVMRPSRLRYFGHSHLVRFIKNIAEENFNKSKKKILIGDLGRPRGGPMISGHVSHQSGLDVDIWFLPMSKKINLKSRERLSATSYVKKNKLKKQWGAFQRSLIELTAKQEDVERVFVHAAIKKELCLKYKGEPWLYKVRPWYGHDDHLHVRLKCPNDGSSTCVAQDALDANNDQCGEDLAWWFSKEAEEELAKKRSQFAERAFPKLPEQCESLVDMGVLN
ncbi:MAG: penicillin-insensitive murein endopeptidase [Oligoflexia bacterium]|nr:penicillin-insensitive murein endopeptidase [Oligoflexia bacterium]